MKTFLLAAFLVFSPASYATVFEFMNEDAEECQDLRFDTKNPIVSIANYTGLKDLKNIYLIEDGISGTIKDGKYVETNYWHFLHKISDSNYKRGVWMRYELSIATDGLSAELTEENINYKMSAELASNPCAYNSFKRSR